MFEPRTLTALRRELYKIAEISLHNLSPQTVLSSPVPQPVSTPGMAKAMEIVSRLPPPVSEKTANRSNYEKTRDVVAPAIGGAAVGNMLASMTHGNPSVKRRIAMGIGGAALSVADKQMLRSMQRKKKTAGTFLSPAMQLKSSRQIGTLAPALRKGPVPKALSSSL